MFEEVSDFDTTIKLSEHNDTSTCLAWKEGHSNVCAPIKIEKNDELGRYLTATRDIKEGEKIMQVSPLILAPKAVTFPLCLACHKKLNAENEFYKCSKCEWPLCNMECENSKFHFDECRILAQSPFRPKVSNDYMKQSCYSIIAPLRALLLKENSPAKFAALIDMQSHLNATTPNISAYHMLKRSLVPFMRTTLKMDTTENELMEILSIFDVNSFDVRDAQRSIELRGLYPIVSLMAHDCKQNTKHVFNDENFDLSVYATVPIGQGEIITTTYTQSLWGTLPRLSHLRQSKNFDCTCKRCADPTEFGTYIGSMYCSECKETNNSENCPKIISTDPLDAAAEWKCETCDYFIEAEEVTWMNDAIKFEMKQLDKRDPSEFENFLVKYEEILHPSNSHVLEAKYALSQMYGNVEGFLLKELSDELLSRKIDLCHELLKIAEVLQPGLTTFRGYLLYDLQAAMVIQAERQCQSGIITKETADKILLDASNTLQESARILESEPNKKDMIQLAMNKS